MLGEGEYIIIVYFIFLLIVWEVGEVNKVENILSNIYYIIILYFILTYLI
jgi:hypothetical protein